MVSNQPCIAQPGCGSTAQVANEARNSFKTLHAVISRLEQVVDCLDREKEAKVLNDIVGIIKDANEQYCTKVECIIEILSDFIRAKGGGI